MRGKPTAHVPESRLDKPKCDQDFHKPHSSTHRRRRSTHMRGRRLGKPRICAEQHAYAWRASFISKFFKTHVYALKQAYAWKTFKPSLSYEDPRIGVEVHAYAWRMQDQSLQTASPTHMRGVLRICVGSEQNKGRSVFSLDFT
ncbi:hypothetical protein PIB30_091153 [Stylosanthes scabra]|uniref:Uncharacterized protein n=1 Tax=Stylosanthes scabra TaxID=79078 RepID=A0ABU6WVR8_9FABA|nr:hypothetical protein [Stylosanthes scabra]